MTPSHLFLFKAFLRSTIVLKRPFHRDSLGNPFLVQDFPSKRTDEKAIISDSLDFPICSRKKGLLTRISLGHA